MSLKPQPVGEIPEATARVAKASFRKPSPAMRLRDEFGALYQDEDFVTLFPTKGQPALAPWRLALVTVLQFMENLTDRQAADAVRGRLEGFCQMLWVRVQAASLSSRMPSTNLTS